MVDGDDLVVRAQHVLVAQVADRKEVGEVPDRHHGDDLLAVEEQGQRPLDRHRGLHRLAPVVAPGDAADESRIAGIGPDEEGRGRAGTGHGGGRGCLAAARIDSCYIPANITQAGPPCEAASDTGCERWR